MYRYLLDHPDILPCKVKEPQFFSKSAWYRFRHFSDYRALFPKIGSKEDLLLKWYIVNESGRIAEKDVSYRRSEPDREITGEASANTYCDVPPQRLKRVFPDCKAILMLRDPVQRAWSHYRMFERFQAEGRRLPFRLKGFEADSANEVNRYQRGKRTYFVGQGVYADRIASWLRVFGDDLRIVIAEQLRDTSLQAGIMHDLTRALEVADHDFSTTLQQEFNVAGEARIDPAAEHLLRDFYEEHNERLRDATHLKLPWS